MSDTPSTHATLTRRLYIVLALNAIVVVGEFIVGFVINSTGIIGDAAHNLIDQGSLFLALYAHILASRPPTEAKTFGYHRAGIITAFANAFILILTALTLGVVAIQRILTPVFVPGEWIIVTALTAFGANLGIAFLLKAGARDDLNIRSAFWHMLADAWVSLGVVASGVGIVLTGWSVLDPLISLAVVGVIVKGAWPLLRESVEILLESKPPGIQTAHLVGAIEKVPGVKNVHDLHIWAVNPRLVMLTCHVMVEGDDSQLTDHLLGTIRERVATEFGIKHLTIQMETHCALPETLHCDLSTITDHGEPAHLRHHHS